MDNLKKIKVLIFIISYNHEKLLGKVLDRIPESLHTDYPNVDFEILIIDDASKDKTFEAGYEFLKTYTKFKTTLLANPVNQQFGGNQKIGYEYAIENNFDHVVLLHGDGQYAPEMIPTLIKPLVDGEVDAVFGSRMMDPKGALKGGMPKYKFLGNKILTKIENSMLGSSLTEWHSGFRLYSVNALKKMPFQYSSNYYDFDTQIIIQLVGQGLRIKEIPIPTYYGDEECNVDGLKYARKILIACMLFKVQDWGIFYHPCYYLEDRYKKKPSRVTFDTSVKRLIDKLRETKGKSLVIIDKKEYQVREYLEKENFNIDVVEPDFDHGIFNTSDEKYEAVFFIDSFECVSDIEKLLIDLREGKRTGESKCYGVIANVAFIFTRIMHLFGAFNYGVRGILDFRHKRLFTYSSLKRLLEYHSCKIEKLESISVPWKLVFKSKILVGIISGLWNIGVKLLKGLFAYQYYFEFSSLPSLRVMLERTRENTKKREEELKK
ncbi:MAG: glycosyltransferase family 2 protein [Bdellovibrionota bacterium]|nr:glycosyltransferase family 2 protein [Pseudomonadota bacterium]MDY6090320.1 glycosyltransferase family 2 protein [Bdellovibrionota bacterium]